MIDVSWRNIFFIMGIFQTCFTCFICSGALSSLYNSTIGDDEKEDSTVPNLQPENEWTEQRQTKMRSLEEENQRMIENDRRMMEQGYDPNETTKGFLKSDLNSKSPQQKHVLEGDSSYKTPS